MFNNPGFQTLYQFKNDEIYVAEVRRTDLGGEQAPEKLYHWFQFHPRKQVLEKLIFQSMTSSEDFEHRTFEQAVLQFNPSQGSIQNKAGEKQALENISGQPLPSKFQSLVIAHFSE